MALLGLQLALELRLELRVGRGLHQEIQQPLQGKALDLALQDAREAGADARALLLGVGAIVAPLAAGDRADGHRHRPAADPAAHKPGEQVPAPLQHPVRRQIRPVGVGRLVAELRLPRLTLLHRLPQVLIANSSTLKRC
nr:hypothetical protein [Cereibacter sphaeroides]